MEQFNRTWAEINLDNLKHNFNVVKAVTGPDVRVMGVVKADGYGHGSVQIARMLVSSGAEWLGVSNLLEAVILRRAGITAPILVLGYTPASSVRELYEYDVTQTVFGSDYADEISSAAYSAGVVVKAHLKIDSGMSRLGFSLRNRETLLTDIARVFYQPSLQVTGIFTHFASADEETEIGRVFTAKQHGRFMSLVDELRAHCIEFEDVHCCNSAATALYPEYHQTMVRPGIILYGLSPNGSAMKMLDLRPVMELKSVVSMVKDVYPGDSISYGCTYTAKEPMRIATLPVGYADGYPRGLSNKGCVYVADRIVSIVGRVCMDQMMIDVTGLDVKRGDVVTLFGGASPIGLDNVAGLVGTISYEIMCGISRRVERTYILDGRVSEIVDYTL